ncbi:hypothetical protein PENVUL_c002G05478 [Penicillium vulpinum]|uniref:ASST-domain-containing protein n=1 Tax=Penicillium vulpinum TaxID=29845 RepID=A0A1V6SDM0_9EURO|nr:hypothetical protein PENVUL_c002G05478 [Penicillium vulpinum]
MSPLFWYLFLYSVVALDISNDDDLVTYITLPQHRVLKWNVTYYDQPDSEVAPGYWFVAPYYLNQGSSIDNHKFYLKEPLTALLVTHKDEDMTLTHFGYPERLDRIRTNGFIELDINTSKYLFEWFSGDHITLDESFTLNPNDPFPDVDYLHMNSVDKSANGNYLISARHTNAIYLVSREDGQIIWRLGGTKNDFEMDFQFTGQHSARFVSQNSTHIIISFLDNGANLPSNVHRARPARYESQSSESTLPNTNVLVSWSYYGYMSEFIHDGQLLMEASFASERFSTYRAYKFPWHSRPAHPPTLVSSCYGVNGSFLSTVFHVSWNRATDVQWWRFFARANATAIDREIGEVAKNGFESSFIVRGFMDWVSVQALDSEGRILGVSELLRTEPPEYWPESVSGLVPDDPDAFFGEEPAKLPLVFGAFTWLFMGFVISTIGYICYPAVRGYARLVQLRYPCEGTDEEELGLMKEKV